MSSCIVMAPDQTAEGMPTFPASYLESFASGIRRASGMHQDPSGGAAGGSRRHTGRDESPPKGGGGREGGRRSAPPE